MPRTSDIPSLCYANLRAVHESRMKCLLDVDTVIVHLTNTQIFRCMPDHDKINWSRSAQPSLIEVTLYNMALIQFGVTQ